MHIVLQEPTVSDFLAALHQISTAHAVRRILVVGEVSEARDFVATAKEDQRRALEFSTLEGAAECVGLPRLARAAALETSWDAVFAFSARAREEIQEIDALRYLHLVHPGHRASKVLIISPPKTGTHLVTKLIGNLGYKTYSAWVNRDEWLKYENVPQPDPDSIPSNACVALHQFRLFHDVRSDLIRRWHETGVPAIIFNYRDPRDTLCSFVHYLLQEHKRGEFGSHPSQMVHARILRSLRDGDAQLMHAIRNPTFPAYSRAGNIFRDSAWLLAHPQVCKVSFEELVGASGGGTHEAQARAVARLMRHLSVSGSPADYVENAFDRNSPTFYRGRIGSWREEFNAHHKRAFSELHQDLLELYGYPND